tara:strand:- start:468 stop:584 length:117 start_codon:yes stop_codon:yes gene_type:complete
MQPSINQNFPTNVWISTPIGFQFELLPVNGLKIVAENK